MGSIKGGFLAMVFSILGIVLFVSMFSSVMTALAALYDTAGASTFIAFQTVLGIAPTLLLLVGVVSAGYFYYKGYKSLSQSGTDASGLIRMVIGILEIILFVTLFATIVTNFNTLYTTYSSNTVWIAFGTVITILPTVLFLAGLFAGGATAAGGIRARRARE